MGRREPTCRLLDKWQREIDKNGIKRMSARVLLGTFGYKRRGSLVTEDIKGWLFSQSPKIFIYGLEYARSLNETVCLSRVEQTQIGCLVQKESQLMEKFVPHIMQKLNLKNPKAKFRPDGCQYELDFLCEDEQGRSVVVELKKEDGEKRVVEQIVTYIRLIRKIPTCKDPWGLILTGYADLHTRHALEELEPQYHIDWFIYGLDEPIDPSTIEVRQIHVHPARSNL